MYDLLIKNAKIIDGTCTTPFFGDIAIKGQEVVEVSRQITARTDAVLDATGLIAAPGFVDIQNHSDSYWSLFDDPGLHSMLAQGITTILVGNCGASLAPVLSQQSLLSVRKWHSLSGNNISWTSFKDYLLTLSKLPLGCNVGSLVGYSTIRRGLIGDEIRGLEKSELAALCRTLEEALSQGAFGLSSGLAYSHEAIITEIELYELAKVVKEYQGLLSIHLRTEDAGILEALYEVLDIVRQSEVRLKVSHFKLRGEHPDHLIADALAELEAVYQKHGGVFMDAYPFNTLWQVLYEYLPAWAIEGGRTVMLHHISEPNSRRKILDYLKSQHAKISSLVVASTESGLHIAGKTISEIASNLNLSPEETVLKILDTGGGQILVFERAVSNSVLKEIIAHPQAAIASDGASFNIDQLQKKQDFLVHPRCFNTTTEFLSLVLNENLMPLEQAIYKLTSLPAHIMGVSNRGELAAGKAADIVLFDAKKLTTPKGYEYANAYPDVYDKV
ncbi:MAG TPA: amidohydrolase family protein, partial [Patescibacteria group bacterium]|nr:amidohydrolase family protein [Patescibacteria group bacterium]